MSSSSSSDDHGGVGRMSSAPTGSGPNDKSITPDIEKLARGVRRKFQGTDLSTPLAVADHKKALDSMLLIRDALIRGEEATNEARMSLTCAGVALYRRIAINHGNSDTHEDFHSYETSLALLFVLLCIASPSLKSTTFTFSNGTTTTTKNEISKWEEGTIDATMRVANGTFCDAGVNATASVSHIPGQICQLCIQHINARGKEALLSDFKRYGSIFFRCSAQSLMAALLCSALSPSSSPFDGERDFLSLGVVDFMKTVNTNEDERLSSIAECGESESGQQVLRDLILSFRLPRTVVGVRRTLLLSRESNKQATEQYSSILGDAHDCALRGCKWSYEKDEDIIHKMCALLSGVAIQLCRDSHSVRKHDSFQGRVELPFLETRRDVMPGVARLALIEHTGEWVVFSLSSSQQPKVMLKASGFDGFRSAILLFSSKIV